MPETIPQIRPSFNRSLRLETRPELLSADTGALVQRELMERSGLIDWLTERLHDPRHPSSIRYPLSDLLRTRLLLLGQGWRDQSDADRLRQDPSLRVASQTRRGTAALEEGHGLASQPTLSRLLDTLSREENLPVLHQAVTELACRRIEMIEGRRRKRGEKTPRKKRRKKTMVLDVDGLPVEVHGHPPGSEWNGYYRQRMYHGLVASCAETGDLIDGEIFPGASSLGKKALKLTLRVVDRCRGRLCGSMIVRMDAGFPDEKLGIDLIRPHKQIPHLITRAHRFRATDQDGLFALGKDLTRLTADSLDTAELKKLVVPPEGKKWGSLKLLQNLLATKIPPESAQRILSPLFWIYELRLADAHLPKQRLGDVLSSLGVDQDAPYVIQGYQLLHACISSIYSICQVIENWCDEEIES